MVWGAPTPYLVLKQPKPQKVLTSFLHPAPLLLLFRQEHLHLLGLHLAACARRQRGQGEYEIKIVVRGDAVEPLESAAVTAVYDHVLPVWPLEATDRLHRAAADAHPVFWFAGIDVPGIQAMGAVVAMTSSRRRWTNETMAMFTLEHLFVGIATFARVTRLCVMLFTRKYNSPV